MPQRDSVFISGSTQVQ